MVSEFLWLLFVEQLAFQLVLPVAKCDRLDVKVKVRPRVVGLSNLENGMGVGLFQSRRISSKIDNDLNLFGPTEFWAHGRMRSPTAFETAPLYVKYAGNSTWRCNGSCSKIFLSVPLIDFKHFLHRYRMVIK